MFYYWLVPILILAVIGIAVLSYAGRRKARSTSAAPPQEPEPIKRGRFMNK